MRSTTSNQLVRKEISPSKNPHGVSTLVEVLSSNKVNEFQEGSELPADTPTNLSFSEYISTWGGSWMWEDIDDSQTTNTCASWIAEGLKAETLIWTTDGSHDRKRAANLSGVGWNIFCKKTGLWLTGSFWEKSPTKSSFCTEMLRLCSLHLLARTIAEYHNVKTWSAIMSCENK